MEFNPVKSKLNLIYTGSLLIILIIFIVVLYLFISGAIKNEEIEQLNRFFEKEKHDFVKEIYEHGYEKNKDHEHEHERLEYQPGKNVFYYIFDNSASLVEGEETVEGLAQYLNKNDLDSLPLKFTKEMELKETHVLLIRFPLQVQEKSLGSVIIGMDITDEKHLIQRIIWILLLLTLLFSILFAWAGNFFAGQAMKPIQTAFQTQRKFVSDASHELRTPLSIFYSSIDVLAREERENLSPFGREILEDVKNESEMMKKLLNDLLFLARNDQKNFELDLEEIDLSHLLHSLSKRFRRIVPAHLSLEEYIQNGISMKADKVRIEQLIYILLDNAIRYTTEGKITCSLVSDGTEIVIRIKDTGPGIPLADLNHIFDRFYRGDSSRKRDGSGLGLAIAKAIVDAHRGKIEVKSEIDKGTEFVISFQVK
ncbi:HAMP domain-containing sensor histidine kinase [Fredinandcohnia sp. QZ13]|uniref:sensor histidine kinase n=1 Tax=Fredinandcohnia sp. QZ13 TaxID=3073144 RepID=UPI002852FBF5|nr:HAMP domain-containing sensor histidine kinase [Fredinandcohnia sp. QZ13]MDR4887786.1 HAMP domain-containing sensor histidine kinase [Fredinandcohnia sp. QZ13]